MIQNLSLRTTPWKQAMRRERVRYPLGRLCQRTYATLRERLALPNSERRSSTLREALASNDNWAFFYLQYS
jgi:hypothetical protein